MRSLLVFIIRLALLAIFTFAFVVLFEHGPAKFPEGAKAEWNALLFFVGSVVSSQENTATRAVGQTSPTPASRSASTSSPAPKPAQAGPGTNRPAPGTPAPNR